MAELEREDHGGFVSNLRMELATFHKLLHLLEKAVESWTEACYDPPVLCNWKQIVSF